MDDWNQKYRLWYTDNTQYIENFVNRVKDGLSEEEVEMVRQEIGKTPPWIGFALHSDWCHGLCQAASGDHGSGDHFQRRVQGTSFYYG